MSHDSSEDETDRQIRAEIRALLATPQKRIRRPTPPHLRTQVGRIALALWRKQLWYSETKDRYERWWFSLNAGTGARINGAIEAFTSIEEFREAYLRQQRPQTAPFEVGPERARFDELREDLPQIDLDTFITLLSKSVARRSRYAEAFGKRVVGLLKDFLEIPAHRPRFKPSRPELEDDLWMRRLAAYIWNFPEIFC